MKRVKKYLTLVFAIVVLSTLLLSGCGKKGIPALHVDGLHLVDEKGNTVQLKGISTHGIAWFPQYINEECIHEFHELFGINVLRIAMYTEENLGYCNGGDQEALKALIDKAVQITEKEGMYAIIDWHILRDGSPAANMDEAMLFFEEMSKKYAEKTHVLYEICNEPNGQYGSWQKIVEYADVIIPIIRANDPDSVIICGTPSHSKLCYAPQHVRPADDKNVVYTMHFYAASDGVTNRKDMQLALDSGIPVFVSEFGICEASGNGRLDVESGDAWMDLCDENGISYVIWNLSNKDESCALIKPDVTKTSGFTLDDLSESALWYYHRLTGK